MRGLKYIPVIEPGANPRPFNPKLLSIGKEVMYPIYPCKVRKLTKAENKKYGVEG